MTIFNDGHLSDTFASTTKMSGTANLFNKKKLSKCLCALFAHVMLSPTSWLLVSLTVLLDSNRKFSVYYFVVNCYK